MSAHAARVAEHARARERAPAHVSPWRLAGQAVAGQAVAGQAVGEIVVKNVEVKRKRRTKAQREARLVLIGRTIETPSGALTLSEEQVDAMSDDEVAAALASAKAQDAAEAAQPE